MCALCARGEGLLSARGERGRAADYGASTCASQKQGTTVSSRPWVRLPLRSNMFLTRKLGEAAGMWSLPDLPPAEAHGSAAAQREKMRDKQVWECEGGLRAPDEDVLLRTSGSHFVCVGREGKGGRTHV